MSSDHHHNRYFSKGDAYGSTSSGSKRYHSPVDSGGRGSGSLAASRSNVGGGGYYDTKRSRTDTYGTGGVGSFHTPSSSTRYNDYNSTSSFTSSNRYKPTTSSSYYEPGLKSSTTSSKYYDDYKGNTSSYGSRGLVKSSVRRIPQPPHLSSSLSKSSTLKSSIGSSSRPPPLMKLNTATSGGGSSARDNYGGSRLRTAPPEHHSSSGYGYSSTSHRKSEIIKRPLTRPVVGVLRNPRGPAYSATNTNSAFRRATLRTAASVTSKIRRRAVGPSYSTYEDRRKRIESYSSRRSPRPEKRRIKTEPRDKSKDSDTKEAKGDAEDKEEMEKVEVNLPDGQVGVVLDEVGGDSESDEEKVDDEAEKSGLAEDDDTKADADGSAEKHNEEEGNEKQDKEESTDRSKTKRRSREEREASPSSRALLKLYCKYCDVRHVTFREYSHHLRSFPHIRAMNNSVTDMRKQLSKHRTQQRDDQRCVEKESKVELSDTTSYCRVCELNFRTDPKEHEANVLHNEIKTVIYQRCDICDIDFRIWKVYLYHMAALEHVKRVAMKELKEAEGNVNAVKGTNLTQEELGADLVEVRTVFFCNACVRYLPIKGEIEEAKERHCMTLTHVKGVEEFRQREKKIIERQRIRMEREEREKERKLREKLKEEKAAELEKTAEQPGTETEPASEIAASNVVAETEEAILPVNRIKMEVCENEGEQVENEGKEVDEQEVDEDEIELHAGEGVDEDEENDAEETGSWNRRTRSAKSVI